MQHVGVVSVQNVQEASSVVAIEYLQEAMFVCAYSQRRRATVL